MSQVASAQVGVLVVDDQDPYRRAMSAVVDETEGFAVVGVVASGEESVAAATELRPDLVLMDVNLPGIDGIQAAREIRAVASAPVVVLLSTYDEDDFDLSGCGAAAYISKSALSSARLLEVWSNRHELRRAGAAAGSLICKVPPSPVPGTSSAPPHASIRSTIARLLRASRSVPLMATTSSPRSPRVRLTSPSRCSTTSTQQ